jgi:hypothetical protein
MNKSAPISSSTRTTQITLSSAPSSVEHSQVLRMVGRDISVVLVERGTDEAKLELPSGQVITAKGDLPFPDKSQLQVRVGIQDGLIKLQILEAAPPSPSSILGPLIQNEANTLIRQLQATNVAEALLPLARLFTSLVPTQEMQLQKAIDALPISSQRLLSMLIGLKDNSTLTPQKLIDFFGPVTSLPEMANVSPNVKSDSTTTATDQKTELIIENLIQTLKSLPEEQRNIISNSLFERNEPDIEIIAKAIIGRLEKFDVTSINNFFASQKITLTESAPMPALQSLIQVIENMPTPARTIIALATLGTAESEPKAIADFLTQKGIVLNIKPESTLTVETTSSIVRQILSFLPNEFLGSLSSSITGKANSDINDIIRTLVDKLAATGREQPIITITTELFARDADPRPEMQKMIRILDSLPAPIKQAIAASVSSTEMTTVPKNLPELLIQKGINLDINQNAVSQQEITSSLLRQVLSILPSETLTNISTSIFGRADADIQAIVKMIVENLVADSVFFKDVSDGVHTDSSESAEIDIEFLTKETPQKNDTTNNNSSAILRDARSDSSANLSGKTANITEPVIIAKQEKPDHSITSKGIQDNVTANTSGKFTGSSESMISAKSQKTDATSSQGDVRSNVSIDAPNKLKSASDATIKAKFEIPDNSSNTSSNIRSNSPSFTASRTDFDAESVVRTIFVNLVNSKDLPVVSKMNLPDNTIVKPDAQRLTQTLENMPVAIRRAIASATLGFAEAEPKAIAEYLIQKGIDSSIKQDIAAKLEATSPIMRQVITLFSGLPLDSAFEKVTNTVLSGDKAVLEAVKGLLSQAQGEAAIPLDSTGNTQVTREKTIDFSVALANRLSYLLSFESLNSQIVNSPQDRDSLSSWFRTIVDQLIIAKSLKSETSETRRDTEPHESPTSSPKAQTHAPETTPRRDAPPTRQGTTQDTRQPVHHDIRHETTSLGEKPQTWQTWLKGSMRALADQSVFSKEAIFHTLAGKENVNFFELPLPWMPGRNLEMWVEADGENNEKDTNNTTHRVLLSLNFSLLGETRIGLESRTKRLNVRVWTERPRFVEKEIPRVQDEISALGFEVQIALQQLTVDQDGVIPSIKSVLTGQSLHAMG